MRLLLKAAFLASCLLQRAAGAQQAGTLSGRVTDRSTGKGVGNAEIILLSDGRSVTSDSVGKYSFIGLPPGGVQLMVRAVHFPVQRIIVDLIEGQASERPILLDSTAFGRLAAAQTLPLVGVTAPAPNDNYRLVAFERRRLTGRGQYLTEDDILKSGAYNVADAVKTMRGVTYECGGGGGCFVRMSRAPMRCLPEYIVDDQVFNDFGPSTPIRDIVALELYTGPSDVPGEYAGRNSGCGIVVIWTRAGPTHKRRR